MKGDGHNMKGGSASVPGAKSGARYASGYVGNTTKKTHQVGPRGIKGSPDRSKGAYGGKNNIAAHGSPRG